jgi:hypothetical protein
LPTKAEPVPMVAELPICQKMLHSEAPLIRLTTLPEPVINVESVWKMKTAFGSFWPSSVIAPVSSSGPLAAFAYRQVPGRCPR